MTDLAARLASLSPAQRELLALRARRLNLDLAPVAEAPAAETPPPLPAPVGDPPPDHGALPPIPRRRQGDPCPLSVDQERIFFIHSLNPASPFYNIYTAIRYRGTLDAGRLGRALAAVLKRHEALRTRFVLEGGQVVQVVEPPFDPGPAEIDLRGLPAGVRAAAADRAVTRLLKAPFALDRLPLLRIGLVRVTDDEQVLIYSFHHIIIDWVSFHSLQREITLLYRAALTGAPALLPALAVQYADYALWQRRRLTGQELGEQLAYWRQHLQGAPQVTELPLDHPRPAWQRGEGRRHYLSLPAPLAALARQAARREGVTLFILFLTLFKLLVVRLAGQERVVIGSPLALREHPDLEPLLGFFLNQLALYTDLSGARAGAFGPAGAPGLAGPAGPPGPQGPDVREALRRVRTTVVGAFSHREVPFGQVVEMVHPVRDLGRMPLTQLTFLYLNPGLLDVPALPGVEQLPYKFDGESSKFDVTLAVSERAAGFDAVLEHNSELFDAATAARFAQAYLTLATDALEHVDRPLPALALLSPAERQQVELEWSDGGPLHPAGAGGHRGLHHLVAERVARTPDAVAVDGEDATLTYGGLLAAATALAAELRASGVGTDRVVALLVHRSTAAVAAMLGVLLAGGAYLPLDPEYPEERVKLVLADAGARWLITEPTLHAAWREKLGALDLRLVVLGRGSLLPRGGAAALAPVPPESLAYVLYTSGSTGRPKGVMVPHRAVCAVLRALAERPGLAAEDRLCAVTTFSFDISVLEVFLPLLTGARLVLAGEGTVRDGEALARRLAESRTTCLQATPATWRLLLASGLDNQGDRRDGRDWRRLAVWCGGEALPPDLAAELAGRGRQLWNLYGPTETTIWSAAGRVESGEVPVPLGPPIAGARLHLLDAAMRPVPLGVAGEVYIGGAGLARGYHRRADLTAERFLPDPFVRPGGEPGARLYRVGDLARWRSGGQLEFLGRVDQQIKLRGFRIELGEIEAALAAAPGVAEAAAALQQPAGGEARLVAFVVPAAPAHRTAAGNGSGGPSGGAASGGPSGGAASGGLSGGAASGALLPPSDALEGWDGAAGIQAALRGRLPEYMVPRFVVPLAALPRTPNGKLDRAALARRAPAGAGAPPAGSAAAGAARSAGEELVAEIWCQVLGVPRIGRDDDFFAAGGHSLLAMQVQSRIRDVFRVELPVRALFEAPTVAQLARLVLQRLGDTTAAAVPPLGRSALPAGVDGGAGQVPLSFAQQRLWFLDRLVPGSTSYSMPYTLRLHGALDVAALAGALAAIVRRHAVLRTTFVLREAEPVQEVAPARRRVLPLVDLAGCGGPLAAAEARRLAAAEAARPFDLARGPLWRASLIRLAADDHQLLLNQHHTVFDGWSIGVFHRELAALYAAGRRATGAARPGEAAAAVETGPRGSTRAAADGRETVERAAAGPDAAPPPAPPLSPLRVQYADYAVWQRQWLSGAVLAEQVAYWRRQLAALPPVLPLPSDRPRPAVQRFRGAAAPVALPGGLADAVRQLGRRHGATLAMTLLAGFFALLARLSGERRVAVGSPIAGRRLASELESLIGFFVNTLTMVGDLAGVPSFVELLGRTRETALAAYAHQDLPFEKLVDELALERDASRNPLFQVVFAVQSAAAMVLPRLPGLRLEPVGHEVRTSRFDLELHLWETAEGLTGFIAWDTDLFDGTSVARHMARFHALLAAIVAAPGERVGELLWMSAAERHQVAVEWPDAGLRPRVLHQATARRAGATETPGRGRGPRLPRRPAAAPAGGARAVRVHHIADAGLQLQPVGVPGELLLEEPARISCTGGAAAELTASRHVPDPWSGRPGARLRRTGLLARWSPEGRIQPLGRLDRQAVLHGTRLDLASVEAAIRRHPAVREAAVVLSGAPGPHLAAYVLPRAAEEASSTPAGGDRREQAEQAEQGGQRRRRDLRHRGGRADDGTGGTGGDTGGRGGGSLAGEQTAGWQEVFDQHVYQGLGDAPADGAPNLAGWIDSYTGEPLAAAAMADWLDDRVERILARRPRRVLEVGCGTGLLLFAIAPHCETYWGTDFSAPSLAWVERRLAGMARPPAGVRLLHRGADDWSGIPPHGFDAVILNSVAQYFPDVGFLAAWIERALDALAPGGVLFLGDLRSLPLLEAFHLSVESRRRAGAPDRRELRQRVRRAVEREKEMAVDPGLFAALRARHPALGAVEIVLPLGRFANELTRFRYDAVLHPAGPPPAQLAPLASSTSLAPPAPPPLPPTIRWLDWRRERLDAEALRQRLRSGEEALGVLGVPNRRLAEETGLLAWLSAEEGPAGGRPDPAESALSGAVPGDGLHPVAVGRSAGPEGRPAAGAAPPDPGSAGADGADPHGAMGASAAAVAAEPDELRRLGEELGYAVGAAWSTAGDAPPAGDAGDFDLVFVRPAALGGRPVGSLLPVAQPPDPAAERPLASYANQPLLGRLAERLVPELRAFLGRDLPEVMVPAEIVVLPGVPAGRSERRALRELAEERQAAGAAGAGLPESPESLGSAVPPGGPAAVRRQPRNDLERRLLALWQEILELPRLGLDDNFFRSGGHSLLAVRLLARVRQDLGLEAPLSSLFTAPTVARMADLLGGGNPAAAFGVPAVVVPIQPGGSRPPFFCVAPVLGTVFPYYELAQKLGPDQPFYGLQPLAATTAGEPAEEAGAPPTIEGFAAELVTGMRAVQPSGPYRLGGWSFGTAVAYEMARQLAIQGQGVELVALIDAAAPVRSQRLPLPQVLRALFDVVLRHMWPYIKDYFYLSSLAAQDIPGGNGADGSDGARGSNGTRSHDTHGSNGAGGNGRPHRQSAGRGRFAGLRNLVQGAGIASVISPESRQVLLHPPQLRAMLRVLRLNSQALKVYRPRPYAGGLTLFVTPDALAYSSSESLGWEELAAGVQVKHLPGSHMTLLRPPNVDHLAAALRASLDAAAPR